jgi:hypothetical protein
LKLAHRNRLVVAAAVALAAGSLVAIAPWSVAGHAGVSSLLTSSDGSTSIARAGATALSTGSITVTDAQWSPDGSRAVFLDSSERLLMVRHDAGADVIVLQVEPAAESHGGHPTWLGAGSGIVWSEQPGADQAWHLMLAPSGAGGLPEVVGDQEEGFNYTAPDAGPASLLVLQRQPQVGGVGTGTPQVWRYDGSAAPGSRFALVVNNGRSPALSPDGTKVAFVRSDGNDEIFVVDLDGSPVVQVTNTATDKDHPTWSHDGATLAFANGAGVATVAAGATGATTVTTVPGLAGVPAYQTHRPNSVRRLAGTSRFSTAAAVSQYVWASAGAPGRRADAVVLSRSDLFADALGGASLAAAKHGPLLLTPPTSLNAVTRAEMIRVLGTTNPAGRTVYILGSTTAISQSVQNQVAAIGYTVVRLAGGDRYTTAIAIAREINPAPTRVLAATAKDFPDALAAGAGAGAYAARDGSSVVILTNDAALPTSVQSYLNGLDPNTFIYGVGNPAAAAVAPYAGEAIVGGDRYTTAATTGARFFQGEVVAGMATGLNWPDALAGGAAMATLGGPLLLTRGTGEPLPPATARLLADNCGSVDTTLVFGSASVVSVAEASEAGARMSGPAAFTLD